MFKRCLVTLKSGEVIIIRPPVYAYFDLFVELYCGIVNNPTTSMGTPHPYFGYLLKLILDPISSNPNALKESDVIAILEKSHQFLEVPELKEYPYKKSPQPSIISSGDPYCDELAKILRSHEKGLDLFFQLDRNSFYRVNHQLGQYAEYERQLVGDGKNGVSRNNDDDMIEMSDEDKKQTEEVLKEYVARTLSTRKKSLNLEF
jgi:hypothetical protein